MILYAKLASLSYHYYANHDINETVDGFGFMPEFTDNESATLANPELNQIVLSIRGTKPSSVDDLKADGMILMGMLRYSGRYKNALKKIKQLIRVKKEASLIVVGHSLGGSIALELAKDPAVFRAVNMFYCYNPGFTPADAMASLTKSGKDRNKIKQKVKIYTTGARDLISAFSGLHPSAKTVRGIDGHFGLGSHKLSTFIPKDQRIAGAGWLEEDAAGWSELPFDD